MNLGRHKRLALALALAAGVVPALAAPAPAAAACAHVRNTPHVKGLHLTKAEKQAITIKQICATRARNAVEVDVTFAGDLETAIGVGHLGHLAVGLVASKGRMTEARIAASTRLLLVTTGPGIKSTKLASLGTAASAVVRHGNSWSFFLTAEALGADKHLAVASVILGRGRARRAQRNDDLASFAQLLSGATDTGGIVLPPPATVRDCAELMNLINQATNELARAEADLHNDQVAFEHLDAPPSIDTREKQAAAENRVGSDESAIDQLPGWISEAKAEYAKRCGPKPPMSFGSNLSGQPQSLLGAFVADVAYMMRKIAAAASGASAHAAQAPNYTPSATVPADGTITSFTLKGYAISGDMPGPGGSEPIRFSVARPQPNGQLQVITTTNPPYTLPGTSGTYTFSTSTLSFKCCKVKAGDVISLDARGGEFAVFAPLPGSETDTFSMAGPTQNPGYMWTPTPHPNVELLLQVTEQPG